MTPTPSKDPDARTAVLNGLERLRALFPLEVRLHAAEGDVRRAYAGLLRHWLRAAPPAPETVADALRAELLRLDAIVHEPRGLGCYPFSARDTGIIVTLPTGTVNAMCAIDALAISRVARAATRIHATCEACNTSVSCRVEENGSLDHDQTDKAQVFWQSACGTHGSCSQGLCRNIRFLCPDCAAPSAGEVFTLPQATAIGNAFFGFQHALLHRRPDA